MAENGAGLFGKAGDAEFFRKGGPSVRAGIAGKGKKLRHSGIFLSPSQ
jgi:hypothetical protein